MPAKQQVVALFEREARGPLQDVERSQHLLEVRHPEPPRRPYLVASRDEGVRGRAMSTARVDGQEEHLRSVVRSVQGVDPRTGVRRSRDVLAMTVPCGRH
jgi:hypothetical protein